MISIMEKKPTIDLMDSMIIAELSIWCMRSFVCKGKEASSILKSKEKHIIQT